MQPWLGVALIATVAIGWIHVQSEDRKGTAAVASVGDGPAGAKLAMNAIGCRNEEDFDLWAKAKAQGDQHSASTIQLARCRWLESGERVTLLERRLSGNVQILYQGERVWTHKAAIGI